MTREEIIKLKMTHLIKTHEKYDFPGFLLEIRKILGVSRSSICRDMGIAHTRLYYLENGHYRALREKEIKIIAEYYEVPYKLLMSKGEKFIAEGKNTPYAPTNFLQA